MGEPTRRSVLLAAAVVAFGAIVRPAQAGHRRGHRQRGYAGTYQARY